MDGSGESRDSDDDDDDLAPRALEVIVVTAAGSAVVADEVVAWLDAATATFLGPVLAENPSRPAPSPKLVQVLAGTSSTKPFGRAALAAAAGRLEAGEVDAISVQYASTVAASVRPWPGGGRLFGASASESRWPRSIRPYQDALVTLLSPDPGGLAPSGTVSGCAYAGHDDEPWVELVGGPTVPRPVFASPWIDDVPPASAKWLHAYARGQAPVEPSFDVVVDGDGSWDGMAFALEPVEPLDDGPLAHLAAVVRLWGAEGTAGAFGGRLHDVGPPVRTTADDGRPVVVWGADLGSAGQGAIDALVVRVEEWRRRWSIGVRRLVAGATDVL